MVLLKIVSSLLLSTNAFGECPKELVKSGEFIVRLKKDPTQFTVQNFVEQMSAESMDVETIFDPHSPSRSRVFADSELPPTTVKVTSSDPQVEKVLSDRTDVLSVEPNCRYSLAQVSGTAAKVTPNDPRFSEQWPLKVVEAEKAWSIWQGDPNFVIAISDTGIDFEHEDIVENIWVNPKEIPGNGIDDDGNGCIDDIHGCDLTDMQGSPMPDTTGLAHGTHVGGIAAAVGNNGIGITGLSPKAKLMAIKAFHNSGYAYTDALVKSIYYGTDNGARIINCSWGRPGTPNQSELDAWAYAEKHDVLVIVAAHNAAVNANNYTPGSISTSLTIASTDSRDKLSNFSNWGTRIDLAAPGGYNLDQKLPNGNYPSVLSSVPRINKNYGEMAGTSMAAPLVAGLAALVWSANPKFTKAQVVDFMKQGADKFKSANSHENFETEYLRINAFKTMKLVKPFIVYPPGPSGRCPAGSQNCSASEGAAETSKMNSMKSALTSRGGCGTIQNQNSGSGSPNTSSTAMSMWSLVLAWVIYLRYRSAYLSK